MRRPLLLVTLAICASLDVLLPLGCRHHGCPPVRLEGVDSEGSNEVSFLIVQPSRGEKLWFAASWVAFGAFQLVLLWFLVRDVRASRRQLTSTSGAFGTIDYDPSYDYKKQRHRR